MARGGRRSPTPGKTYSQRTDLSTRQGALPKATYKSTAYGTSAKLTAAQNAVPVAPQPQIAAPTPSPAGAAPGAGGAPIPPAPGSLPDFHAPTTNPSEPVTAGLPFGPGPGPEVLAMNQPTPSPLMGALASLNSLGTRVSPVVNAVRAQVNALANAAP